MADIFDDLREAKSNYDIAEHNLAVARANLTRAQRAAREKFRLDRVCEQTGMIEQLRKE